jgi:hypothetical protein
MNKAIVQIGYNNYVLDTEKALKLLSLLEEAERYEHKWRKEEEGGYYVPCLEPQRISRRWLA